MIAKTALQSIAAAAVEMPRHGGMRAGQEHQKRLEASLVRLVNGLVAREFTFITAEATAQQMQERLAKFDEGRLGMSGKVFGFMIGMSDIPYFMKVVTKHIVGFGAEKIDDEELAALQQLMRSNFPLCAVAFSRMYGPRFLAIVDGEGITQEELFEAMDCFQEINLCMMQVGGRLSLKGTSNNLKFAHQ